MQVWRQSGMKPWPPPQEEELVDLAAILGFHGMLNQVQYHQAFVENADMKDTAGGFSVHARPEELKTFGDEDSVNSTNVEESLQRVKDNDPKLKELNLNNIKTISIDTLKEFAEALKTNTSLEILSLCNTRASDKVAKAFAEALRSNKTLKSLSLESNYISGTGILNLIEATNENQTLIELHVANQRPQLLGVQREAKIAELLKENKTIVKLGIFLESRNVQVKVHEILERNYDEVRKDRMAVSNGTKED
ncbi:hypothetical protein NP493_92g07009 [Ridgeia piscesae]|uniref:Tropomodulin n=1 Tax=Ridgeia piscesae TaxID=27915 RepID=A0AAD9UI20_RIDPI|nr:hypothetical protein NP493_92g07009 [Ridgeia piscesae]